MRTLAPTPPAYLESLPKERRDDIAAVLRTVLNNLPRGYEEAMNGGMITYRVPLGITPDTDNRQPLLYPALASQKNSMSIYRCSAPGVPSLRKRLVAEFKAAGKRLDMGKSCIRFGKFEDLPLDVMGRLVAATPMKACVAFGKTIQARKT